MSRIRTVKPGLFKHEELYDAEIESGLPLRLAFIGLFTVADKEGRFQWMPRTLKTDVLPHDDVDFSKVLDALARIGMLRRYVVADRVYGCIPTWKKHQVINQREAESFLPSPDEDDGAYQFASITPHQREQVHARDRYMCVRCNAKDDLTVDHIFPQSIGGTHELTNLRTLCRKCNSARPVAEPGLSQDLAKDGLSLADKQRICAPPPKQVHAPDPHVHARGEGKGREGEGEGESSSLRSDVSAASADLPELPKALDRRSEAFSEAIERWNAMADHLRLPAVRERTPERRRKFNARFSNGSGVKFEQALDAIRASKFCQGDNNQGWRVNFDFLLQPSSLAKLLEGTYADRDGATTDSTGVDWEALKVRDSHAAD